MFQSQPAKIHCLCHRIRWVRSLSP